MLYMVQHFKCIITVIIIIIIIIIVFICNFAEKISLINIDHW